MTGAFGGLGRHFALSPGAVPDAGLPALAGRRVGEGEALLCRAPRGRR
ncbi:hypothetical protein ACU4GD_30825 [Cupriavidus basilensis]